jgi:Tol biopolymer transport system component
MDDPNFVPPAWSPDSRQIAFAGFASGGRRGILVADVATPDSTRYVAGDRTGAGFPAWSPDGQWIAFRATPEGRTLLVVVRPDGSSWRELRSVDGVVDSFTQIGWSPDGRLVYHRQHEGQTVVAVYDLATDTETVVSDPTWYADAPSWSSDGTRIAYHQEQPSGGDVGEATRELVIATADGTQREVRGPITDCLAKFSPDSRFLIAYAPGCFSASAIVVVDAFDPAAPVRTITLPNSIVGAPSWQRVDDGR